MKIADMQLFSSKLSLVFILTVLSTTLLPYTVRSDPNFLKLPSERQENDLCPLNSELETCPMKYFQPDPVCGVDGVTYWCGCTEAHCAGARVKKFGFCEVGNGGSGPAGQALLLVHIIWLILLGVFVLFGLSLISFSSPLALSSLPVCRVEICGSSPPFLLCVERERGLKLYTLRHLAI